MTPSVGPELSVGSDWAKASTEYRAFLDLLPSQIASIGFSFLRAMEFFGVSDAYRRQAERYAALSAFPDRAAYCISMNESFNQLGLNELQRVSSAVAALPTVPGNLIPAQEAAQLLTGFGQGLAEINIKVVDLLQIRDRFALLVAAGRDGGAQALRTSMTAAASELASLRSLPDRGGGNIPFWKIIGIILGIGLLLSGLAFQLPSPFFPSWLTPLLTSLAFVAAVAAALC